jgi:superfamily II DNA or RNA helicase
MDRVLVELCTGYGKTIVGLGAYAILRARGLVDRLLILVPGDDQRQQFCDDVEDARQKLGVPFGGAVVCSKAERELLGNRSGEYEIYVATYQQLNDGFFATLMARGKWMVIPDECHHLRLEGRWAQNADRLVKVFTFYMSATPLRSDRLPLLGVPREPVVSVTYHEAFREKAVRRVKGRIEHYYVEVQTDNGTERITTESLKEEGVTDFSEYEARRQLRYAPGYLDWMLEKPLRLLVQRNAQHPGQHRMVVFAMSCKHAHYVSQQINALSEALGADARAEWIGVGLGLNDAIKTDKQNEQVLEAFRGGKCSVLVQVGKVGEGFNVKQASILVFLHLICADARLLQQVGRGIRRNSDVAWEEDYCVVYASADTPIAETVKKMELDSCETKEPGLEGPDEPNGPMWFDIPGFVVVDAMHDRTQYVSPQRIEMPATDYDREFAEKFNIPLDELIAYNESRAQPAGSVPQTIEMADNQAFKHQCEMVKGAQRVLTGNMVAVLRTNGGEITKALVGKLKREINARWVGMNGKGHEAMNTDGFRRKHRWLQEVNEGVKSGKLPPWLRM